MVVVAAGGLDLVDEVVVVVVVDLVLLVGLVGVVAEVDEDVVDVEVLVLEAVLVVDLVAVVLFEASVLIGVFVFAVVGCEVVGLKLSALVFVDDEVVVFALAAGVGFGLEIGSIFAVASVLPLPFV